MIDLMIQAISLYEYFLFIAFFIIDAEATLLDCPRCTWSDRSIYSEERVNVWAPNEPSKSRVAKIYLDKIIKL